MSGTRGGVRWGDRQIAQDEIAFLPRGDPQLSPFSSESPSFSSLINAASSG
jgi:hypothetical protein